MPDPAKKQSTQSDNFFYTDRKTGDVATSSAGTAYGIDVEDIAGLKGMTEDLVLAAKMKMVPRDYYPGEQQNINVGTYSSSTTGSVPIYAAGMGQYPWGVEHQKAAMDDLAKARKNQEILNGVQFKYDKLENKMLNQNWMDKQENFWNNYVSDHIEKSGGNELLGIRGARIDPERKRYQLMWDNATDAVNEYHKEAFKIMAIKNTGFDPLTNKKTDEYVSDETMKEANKILSFSSNQDIKPEDLESFDPNKLKKSIGIDTTVNRILKDSGVQKRFVTIGDKMVKAIPTNSTDVYRKKIESGVMYDNEIKLAVDHAMDTDYNNPNLSKEEKSDIRKKLTEGIKASVLKSTKEQLDKVSKYPLWAKQQEYNYRKSFDKPVVGDIQNVRISYNDGTGNIKEDCGIGQEISDPKHEEGLPFNNQQIPEYFDSATGKIERNWGNRSGYVIGTFTGSIPYMGEGTYMRIVPEVQTEYTNENTGKKEYKYVKDANSVYFIPINDVPKPLFDMFWNEQKATSINQDAEQMMEGKYRSKTLKDPIDNQGGSGSGQEDKNISFKSTDTRTYNGKSYTVADLKKTGWTDAKIQKYTK